MHSHVGIDLHDIVNLIAVSHVFLLKFHYYFTQRILAFVLICTFYNRQNVGNISLNIHTSGHYVSTEIMNKDTWTSTSQQHLFHNCNSFGQ